MKNLIIVLSLLLFCTISFGQNFEGYIFYKNTFVDSLGNDITAEISPLLGLEQHYYIDSMNYVGLNEAGVLAQLYNVHDNTYYFVMNGQIQRILGSYEYPKELSIQTLESTTKILSYECESKIFTSENGQTTYFYNKSVSVDPKPFMKQKFGHWGAYLEASNGALPLKFINVTPGFTQISEAKLVKVQDVDKSFFDLQTYIEKE